MTFEFVSIAGSFLQTPARSLANDVCPIHQQNLMANICSFFSGVGGIVTNIIGGLKLYEYTSLTQEPFMLIVSAVMCTIPIISIVVTPEEPIHVKPPCVNPFKEIFSAVKDKPYNAIFVVFPSCLFSICISVQSFHGKRHNIKAITLIQHNKIW